MGTLQYGKKKKFKVTFTNTGKEDFKFLHLQGGCECTVPTDWSRGAVKPGKTGFIEFEFDTNKASKMKGYNSSLEIYGNIPGDFMLYDIEVDIE